MVDEKQEPDEILEGRTPLDVHAVVISDLISEREDQRVRAEYALTVLERTNVEVERLRKALEEIAGVGPYIAGVFPPVRKNVRDLARAALKPRQ